MILQRVSISIVSGAHNLRWTKGGFCLFYGPGNWWHCYSLRGIVIWIRNKFRRVTSDAGTGAARGGDLNIKCLPVRNIIIMTARRYNCLQLFIGADPKNILTSPWSRASHWTRHRNIDCNGRWCDDASCGWQRGRWRFPNILNATVRNKRRAKHWRNLKIVVDIEIVQMTTR